MAELKSCQFCGATPRIVTRNVEPQNDPWYGRKDETFVLCDCGACLFDGDFHEGFWDAETRAVEAWNRRTSIGDTPAPQSTEGGEVSACPFRGSCEVSGEFFDRGGGGPFKCRCMPVPPDLETTAPRPLSEADKSVYRSIADGYGVGGMGSEVNRGQTPLVSGDSEANKEKG